MKLIRITTVPLSLDKLLGQQLAFMNTHFEVTAISADEQELKRVAAKYGVRHYHVEMTREITPLKDMLAVWKMYRFLRKEKPETVHTHTPKAGLVGLMAAWLARVPVRMHTVAGMPLMEATGLKRKVLSLVEMITYSFATKVYPNSHGLRDIILEEKFCAPDKLKVLANGSSNGIDTGWFSPAQFSEAERAQTRRDLGISAKDFVFVFVGRLVTDKGINELVTAFKNLSLQQAQVPDKGGSFALGKSTPPDGSRDTQHPAPSTQHPSLKLLLVGPLEHELDPLLPQTQTEIDRNPHIISVGYRQDVRPYFAISDALVFPSYREGFPNVVLQAGAMELPSVVTDINGCNEIIEEGQNGLIIPVKDAAALEKAMHYLVTHPEHYERMRYASRPLIESRYRQEVAWEALLEEYRRVG